MVVAVGRLAFEATALDDLPGTADVTFGPTEDGFLIVDDCVGDCFGDESLVDETEFPGAA